MNCGALSTILQGKRPVPERTLAKISWQVLEGLDYLHSEMHVIHRDIKPSNLLLSSSGIVKITDFGVSGELEDDLEQKKKVTFVGTIHYMSPERVIGKPYEYNSDMWSLGLTLLECIFLRYPYSSPEEAGKQFSFWELMRRIVERDPPSLPPTTEHSNLQDFLQQVLRKDPQSRPGAAAMKAHAWLSGLLQSAHYLELAAWIAEQQQPPQAVVERSPAKGPGESPTKGLGQPLRGGVNPFQAGQGGYSASSSKPSPGGSAPAVEPSVPTAPQAPKPATTRPPRISPSIDQSHNVPAETPSMDQSLHRGRGNPFLQAQTDTPGRS